MRHELSCLTLTVAVKATCYGLGTLHALAAQQLAALYTLWGLAPGAYGCPYLPMTKSIMS